MVKKSPVDYFFAMGDYATRGDPKRKADFDYYLLWVILAAFSLIAYTYFHSFYTTGKWGSLGWGVVILCIIWFQYFTLKMAHDARKLMKSVNDTSNFEKVEDVDKMMEVLNGKQKPGRRNRNKK